MTVILEEADFLAGAAGLTWALTDTCLGAELEMVEAGAAVELEGVGFPTFDVERTGVELTNTGSVEGIGLPSLV